MVAYHPSLACFRISPALNLLSIFSPFTFAYKRTSELQAHVCFVQPVKVQELREHNIQPSNSQGEQGVKTIPRLHVSRGVSYPQEYNQREDGSPRSAEKKELTEEFSHVRENPQRERSPRGKELGYLESSNLTQLRRPVEQSWSAEVGVSESWIRVCAVDWMRPK